MNKEAVWLHVTSAWSDTGLSDTEYFDQIQKINASHNDLAQLKYEFFSSTCGAFALDIIVMFLTLGMSAPDWGFEENYVINKVKKWKKQSFFYSVINPFWWTGYFLACLTVYPLWRRTKKSISKS